MEGLQRLRDGMTVSVQTAPKDESDVLSAGAG